MFANPTSAAPMIALDTAQMNSTALYNAVSKKGRVNGWLAFVTGRSNRLIDMDTLLSGKQVRGQWYGGRKLVAIDAIQATEGRARDFDREFNPLKRHNQGRWLQIARARFLDLPLPPVELIKVGERYAVRDGHHRISVARALGESHVDAKVTIWQVAGELPWDGPAQAQQRATVSLALTAGRRDPAGAGHAKRSWAT